MDSDKPAKLTTKSSKNVSSKCGSLENASHKAGGGHVQIFDKKPAFNKSAHSKIGSLDNSHHVAGGGNVHIHDEKLHFTGATQSKAYEAKQKEAESGTTGEKNEPAANPPSKESTTQRRHTEHVPVKITSKPIANYKNVASKCGSMENATHKAGGGHVEIFDKKPVFKDGVQSKIGSLENAHHVAGGGNVHIHDEKLHFTGEIHSKVDDGSGTHQTGGKDSSAHSKAPAE